MILDLFHWFVQSSPVMLCYLWWAGPLRPDGAGNSAGSGNAGNSLMTPLGQAASQAGLAPKPSWQPVSINRAYYVILKASGVPQQGPSVFVPPNTLVSVRAHNGTNAGNTNTIRISKRPETFGIIDGDPLTPDSDISWPVDNLNQLWVLGTAGDGVRVAIQAGKA